MPLSCRPARVSMSSGSSARRFKRIRAQLIIPFSGSLPLVATGSAVTGVNVNATASAVLPNASAGGQGGARSSARYRAANKPGSSSYTANHPPPTSATGSSGSGSSRRGSLATLHTFAGTSLNAGASKQSALGNEAMELGLTGKKLESSLASAKIPGGLASARSSGKEALAGGESSSAGGAFAADFPDSTENTAVISPPDPANHPLFSFEPSSDHQFPDLANHQFLQPTFHIGGERSSRGGSQNKEDLYSRIEHRLSDYRGAEVPNNGLKPEKRSHASSFGNPFAERPATAGDELIKPPDPGLSF